MTALDGVAGRLIVSVQVHRQDDPMGRPAVLAASAESVVLAGAGGIRCGGIGGPDAVRAVASAVDVPVIGLWKIGDRAVYITPTATSAIAVAMAGADIVAFDASRRDRSGADPIEAIIDAIHGAGALALGDVSSVDEARAAIAGGADAVATTLSGFVGTGVGDEAEPDVDLVRAIAHLGIGPVIAEGRYVTPAQVLAAFAVGAHAVVVGRAITSPFWLASTFGDAIAASGAGA